MKCCACDRVTPTQAKKRTFGRPGHQLHQAVGLVPSSTTTNSAAAAAATIVLGVLRCSFFSVSGLRDAGRWCGGQSWRDRGAGGEAGGSGKRQGEGGGGPAGHVCDAFILQLLQVKLDDFFSLRGKKRIQYRTVRATGGISTQFEVF